MNTPRAMWSRPLVQLVALGVMSLFIAAPTPGNVGGCSGSAESQPAQAGSLTNTPPETAEYMYFDQGLCASTCWRLRECNLLCQALGQQPDHCSNDDSAIYSLCVRGPLRTDVFGRSDCPHACPPGYRYHRAYGWDVEACGQAIEHLSCGSGTGSIGNAFSPDTTPTECTNVCYCDAPSSLCPDGACSDVSSDPAHCGSCTTRCAANQMCRNGHCQ